MFTLRIDDKIIYSYDHFTKDIKKDIFNFLKSNRGQLSLYNDNRFIEKFEIDNSDKVYIKVYKGEKEILKQIKEVL